MKSGLPATLRIKVNQSTSRTTFVPIKAFSPDGIEITGDYGNVNIKNGTIEIFDIALTPYTLTIPFKNNYFVSSLNNIVNVYQTEVTLTW